MTQPGQQGYPDFGRLATQANVLFNNEINVNVVNAGNRGPFYVGNVSHIGVNVKAYTTGTRFLLQFWADKALTTLLSSIPIDLQPGTFFKESIPVLGPQFAVTFQTVAANGNVDLQLWHAAGPFIPLTGNSIGSVLVSVDGVNVGAGSGVTDQSVRAHLGWAQWSATMDAAAAWNHKLQVVDYTGAVTTLEYTSTDTGRRSGLIFLPGALPQIASNNADGVARARHVFLHALPGVP